ncbi:hypothetical protein ACFL5L_03210 [candidate division KSB1 bacterium]
MTDEDYGKKLLEEEDIYYFIEAYTNVTNKTFGTIVGSENPEGGINKRFFVKNDADEIKDYGMILKLNDLFNSKYYIILAGIGPFGTLAACIYFANNYFNLENQYSKRDFLKVISVINDAFPLDIKEEFESESLLKIEP